MSPGKRLSDLVLALLLAALLAPVMAVLTIVILLRDGAPVLYLSDRAGKDGRVFRLWKFRTMVVVDKDDGVSGGDKTARITGTGRFLRRGRLDELPQLYNIIRGDMSFVGPRPPLPRYVRQFPELYGPVLQSPPGVTGLATLAFHKAEERLLADCTSAEETERVYTTRCIPRKARLDLIYAANRTLCYDYLLMLATVFRNLPLKLPKKELAQISAIPRNER